LEIATIPEAEMFARRNYQCKDIASSIGPLLIVFLATFWGCDADELAGPDVRRTSSNPIAAAEGEGGGDAKNRDDWTQFRGSEFSSTVDNSYRTEWGTDNGIIWKTELPGRGASSPIVSGDHLYLTAYDGFGLSLQEAGDFKDLRHHVLCFDRESGKPVWQRVINGTSLLQKVNTENIQHGFASSTPVTDGEKVFAFFGVTGIFAFEKDGTPLWQRNLGLNTHHFGSSASPVLYDDLLIVNASLESRTVYGIDKHSGSMVWKIPNIVECWSMPVIGKSEDGRTEMVISSKNTVAGFNPATGEQLWHCKGIQDYVVSVPIIVDGILYLTGGKTKQTMAIRLGGTGDVEDSHKIWEIGRLGANVSSPVYRDGRLYIFHDSGIVQVIDAETGKLIKRQRTATRTRPYASPLLAGRYLYMPFQDAGIGVFEADESCKQVAVNSERDELPLMSSIAPSGDRFFFRNDKFLYCVGDGGRKTEEIRWQPPENHELVKTIESFNIDPEKGWSRRYLGFLTPDFDRSKTLILMPYQSVITEDQTRQANELIKAERPQYEALLTRFEKLQRDELTTPADQSKQFNEAYAQLEKDVNALNSQVRIRIKKLFTKQQMEKHIADAKAGKAHLKPESQPEK
jgi:outer membrane protein assembly factor BamB